ncbi:hypothetical protein GCM10010394_04300 [Streptomyces crystallinus]|uniref:Uncharacterized protein n=1 Tax=Streptomyces crystallinus TaxID=68191 RepID=A0ABP3Q3F6_9ACTN
MPGGPRTVLYTDSEGRASLIAESPAEALTLAIVLPSWHDALAGFRPPTLNADYRADHPNHPTVRDRLLTTLRLPPATEQKALTRLLTTPARTVPEGFLPYAPDEEDAASFEADAGAARRVGQPPLRSSFGALPAPFERFCWSTSSPVDHSRR